jgi:hypothetical protein
LKRLIFGPNGRPQVAESDPPARPNVPLPRDCEAIADGNASCVVTSVPAADVEGAVLDHVQKLLASPELVDRTWTARARRVVGICLKVVNL